MIKSLLMMIGFFVLTASAQADCTLFLGFSQVAQWEKVYERDPNVTGQFVQFGSFPVGQWSLWDNSNELFWYPGGFIEWWADPKYIGWTDGIWGTKCRDGEGIIPTSQSALKPQRIVINVVSGRFTWKTGTTESTLRADAQFVALKTVEVVKLARLKWGTQAEIFLQPVVGGPGHSLETACGKSFGDTTAYGVQVSRWHIVGDLAIDYIEENDLLGFLKGGLQEDFHRGPDVWLEFPCSTVFKDYRGHLTVKGSLEAAKRFFEFYSGF